MDSIPLCARDIQNPQRQTESSDKADHPLVAYYGSRIPSRSEQMYLTQVVAAVRLMFELDRLRGRSPPYGFSTAMAVDTAFSVAKGMIFRLADSAAARRAAVVTRHFIRGDTTIIWYFGTDEAPNTCDDFAAVAVGTIEYVQ
jgi:hypothetical protein